MMSIIIPVTVAGAGIVAYLLWKKSRANANVPTINQDGTPNAAYLAAQRAGEPNLTSAPIPGISPVDALIRDAGSTAKDVANAAYYAATKRLF